LRTAGPPDIEERVSPPLPLVGRATAVAALREALVSAQARHGKLVVVSGEPGIGKSTLADLIAQDAGRDLAEPR
jgi:MoxR-like ATPase